MNSDSHNLPLPNSMDDRECKQNNMTVLKSEGLLISNIFGELMHQDFASENGLGSFNVVNNNQSFLCKQSSQENTINHDMESKSLQFFRDSHKSVLHSSLAQRLNKCSDRLFQIRHKSMSLLSTLLSFQNSVNETLNTHVPVSLAKSFAQDDTESSTDDNDTDGTSNLSNAEVSWLCTRAVTHSNWRWLLTEIKRSEKCVRRLRALKSDIRKRKCLPLHESTLQAIQDSDGCSRTSSYVALKRTRHFYHDFNSPKCVTIMSELNSRYPTDPFVRCSCLCRSTGPCILCSGSGNNTSKHITNKTGDIDLINSASALSSHIHPKLSIPGDVQLALRLESRLAAFSPVHFRAHKATVHVVPPWDKSVFSRTVEPPDNIVETLSNSSCRAVNSSECSPMQPIMDNLMNNPSREANQ